MASGYSIPYSMSSFKQTHCRNKNSLFRKRQYRTFNNNVLKFLQIFNDRLLQNKFRKLEHQAKFPVFIFSQTFLWPPSG